MQSYDFAKIRKEIYEELSHRKKLRLKEEKVECLSETIKRNIYEKKVVDKVIYNTIFRNEMIEDIVFENCIFDSVEFDSCELKNINFINCNFYKNEECISSIYGSSSLEKCKFINCNIPYMVLEDTYLEKVVFENSNMKHSIFNKVYIGNAIIKDCNMKSFKMINTKVKSLEFEDDYLSKFDEYTFIDEMNIRSIDKELYIGIYKFYRNISYKFEANGILNNAGEYYYISKCIEHKCLRGISKIKSALFWTLCGYGERPTFALITSLEIILLFAILYMITGLNIDGDIINYKEVFSQSIPLGNFNSDFMNSLYFSVVTFTTVGYGDITPVGALSVFLSGIEMLLGVTMVGIWTAILARKITR